RERENDQQRRRRPGSTQHGADGSSRCDAGSPVSPNERAQPGAVLDYEWAVETECGSQGGDFFRRCCGPSELRRRITRSDVEQKKGGGDEAQEDADSREQTGKYSGEKFRVDFRSPL